MLIDETKDKEKISVTTPGGAQMLLDDGGKTIQLKDKENKNSITIDLQAGKLTIKAEKGITLETGSCKLVLDGQGGKGSLESQAELNIKSAQDVYKRQADPRTGPNFPRGRCW